MKTRRSVLSVDGRELAVHEVGDRAAPAAVVAHGVGSSARFILDAFGGPLVSAGYRLVTYDLRGHGDSGPARCVADHALEEHVADLAAVAAHAGARLLGGVSLGAHAAACLAAKTGPRGEPGPGLLLCLPAWTGRAETGGGPHAVIAEQVRRVGLDATLQRALADPATPGWIASLLDRDWRAADGASLAAALVALDGGRAPTAEELARIQVSAVVVGWPDDPGHPLEEARRWASAIPEARLAVTSMDAVGQDPTVLGEVAVRALRVS